VRCSPIPEHQFADQAVGRDQAEGSTVVTELGVVPDHPVALRLTTLNALDHPEFIAMRVS